MGLLFTLCSQSSLYFVLAIYWIFKYCFYSSIYNYLLPSYALKKSLEEQMALVKECTSLPQILRCDYACLQETVSIPLSVCQCFNLSTRPSFCCPSTLPSDVTSDIKEFLTKGSGFWGWRCRSLRYQQQQQQQQQQ